MIRKVWDRIRGLAKGAALLCKGLRGQLRLARAFAALPPDAQDRALADAGLSRSDLPAIFSLRGNGHRHYMKPIAHYFGVPDQPAAPRYQGALRDAERVCAQCRQVRRCRKWLLKGDSLDSPKFFCPNAPLFTELAANDTPNVAKQGQ